jgi:hypothetical protein
MEGYARHGVLATWRNQSADTPAYDIQKLIGKDVSLDEYHYVFAIQPGSENTILANDGMMRPQHEIGVRAFFADQDVGQERQPKGHDNDDKRQ